MAKKETEKSEKSLLIVESPAKAKTIEKYLDDRFVVRSSYGHIRDLPKKDLSIDLEKGYAPHYVISDEKKEVVKELKELAKKSQEVWLATDEDREGEAIAWHLCEALDLDVKTTKRIVFHEITKPAIQKAITIPRTIDINLVNAQQARRVLDRIVGYELSPILWKKISRQNNLSAGRVQSVAVRLIVEREREINGFKIASFYKVVGEFTAKDRYDKPVVFKAELPKDKANRALAEEFLNQCKGAVYTVKDVQVKPGKKSPSAPFTTSTLQQEASRKLGFGVSRTMLVAQKLYESGKITYMRTDSVNLGELALSSIQDEIVSSFGDKYHQRRQYTTKSANAQEAHEAIRPTDISVSEVSGSNDEQRLYSLIWKRTIASQMSDAQLERTTAYIGISTVPKEDLVAKGEVLLFDGFLKVYMESTDDEEDNEEGMLPVLVAGNKVGLVKMTSTQRFTKAAPRYTEASLVKKLEELGIGRPSTYAPTINTVQKRGYVEKGDKIGVVREYDVLVLDTADNITHSVKSETVGADRSKLSPTDMGMLVNDFLFEHFKDVMDYGFTAQIEKEFDDISLGTIAWSKMIDDFYLPFHKDILHVTETADRVSGERILGVDPESGKDVLVRLSRFGPVAQIGRGDTEEKPRYANIRAGLSMETITLDEALTLFKLPRVLGQYEGLDVAANTGRFGPYVVHDKKFFSLKKEMDPHTVTLEEAITVIEAKRNSIIREWKEEEISIVIGRWGPYIKHGKINAKIPKDQKPELLTLEECKVLLDAPKPVKKRFAKKSK